MKKHEKSWTLGYVSVKSQSWLNKTCVTGNCYLLVPMVIQEFEENK